MSQDMNGQYSLSRPTDENTWISSNLSMMMNDQHLIYPMHN